MKTLEKLPYFTLAQLALFCKDKKNATVVVTNKLRQKKLHSIREWIYISDKKLLEISSSGKISLFKEFIATNLVYSPSYLSLEYVLFEHNIISENVYNFTLVTIKKTARFQNEFGTFVYKSIKDSFFWDYETKKLNGFVVYKASPEKALFDYLYFQRWIIFQESYFKELRLNLRNINLKKLKQIIDKYPSRKLEKCFIFLRRLKWL
jgi:DNA primase